MSEKISFRIFNEQDLVFLKKWLKAPHIAEFWQETDDDSAVKHKYIYELPNRGIESFIILFKDRPIGYIQSYNAKKIGNGWWPDAEPGTYDVDLLIGENTLIGKGIGTRVLKEFITLLCRNPTINKIIIDPEPMNLKMIHICEKIGFLNKGLITTPNGQAILLELAVIN